MNRIRRYMDTPPPPSRPQAGSPKPPPAFVMFGVPAGLPASAVVHQLYLLAYEQARAASRPSLPERDLLGYWN